MPFNLPQSSCSGSSILVSDYFPRTRRERFISQAAVKSLLKMISDRDQSHQAGRLQESLSQEQQEGRVGGFLRFSSVDTLLSGAHQIPDTRYQIPDMKQDMKRFSSQMREVEKRNRPSVRLSALWLTDPRLKNQQVECGISWMTTTSWLGSLQSTPSGGTSWCNRSQMLLRPALTG